MLRVTLHWGLNSDCSRYSSMMVLLTHLAILNRSILINKHKVLFFVSVMQIKVTNPNVVYFKLFQGLKPLTRENNYWNLTVKKSSLGTRSRGCIGGPFHVILRHCEWDQMSQVVQDFPGFSSKSPTSGKLLSSQRTKQVVTLYTSRIKCLGNVPLFDFSKVTC